MVATETRSKAARLRELLKTPAYRKLTAREAAEQVASRLGLTVSQQDVYAQRFQMKRKAKVKRSPPKLHLPEKEAPARKARKPVARSSQAIQVGLPIPDGGIVVKLTRNNLAVGTLAISDTGFIFMKANAKKAPNRELKWEHLTRLFESGLLG